MFPFQTQIFLERCGLFFIALDIPWEKITEKCGDLWENLYAIWLEWIGQQDRAEWQDLVGTRGNLRARSQLGGPQGFLILSAQILLLYGLLCPGFAEPLSAFTLHIHIIKCLIFITTSTITCITLFCDCLSAYLPLQTLIYGRTVTMSYIPGI